MSTRPKRHGKQRIHRADPSFGALLQPASIAAQGARRLRGSTMNRIWPPGPILRRTSIPSRSAAHRSKMLARSLPCAMEALPDDNLADKGPGRSNNGNFVLTQFGLGVEQGQDAAQPIKLKSAQASFSQKDFGVELAIDDRAETGWAIHPEIGKPQAATFALEQPLSIEPGKRLSITLEFQSQFAQHQIGRLRMAVTDAIDPFESGALPDTVRSILAVAVAERTDAQKVGAQVVLSRQCFAAHQGTQRSACRAAEEQG